MFYLYWILNTNCFQRVTAAKSKGVSCSSDESDDDSEKETTDGEDASFKTRNPPAAHVILYNLLTMQLILTKKTSDNLKKSQQLIVCNESH